MLQNLKIRLVFCRHRRHFLSFFSHQKIPLEVIWVSELALSTPTALIFWTFFQISSANPKN